MSQNQANKRSKGASSSSGGRKPKQRKTYVEDVENDGSASSPVSPVAATAAAPSRPAVFINDALALLQWAKQHKSIQVSSRNVPGHILANATLHDLKIKPDFRRRLFEDDIYAAHPELQQKITRGTTVLQVGETYQIVIRGFRKFVGLDEQDDDDALDKRQEQVESSDAASAPVSTHSSDASHHLTTNEEPIPPFDRIIVTSKENGEACHMSAVEINGQQFWVIGSKNVHMLLRGAHDIKYYSEQSFEMARIMAQALLSGELSEADNKKIDLDGFRQYLVQNNFTANFECLQSANQHVEPFEFEGVRLRFITFTGMKASTHDGRSLCVAPDVAARSASQYGWLTVAVDTRPGAEIEQVVAETRDMYRKEGTVVYLVAGEDERVVAMKKIKSIWYVLTRAIREKARGLLRSKETRLDNALKRLRKTFRDRQDWLKYDDQVLKHWTSLGTKMLQWIDNAKTSGKKLEMEQFPEMWLQFLEESKQQDTLHPPAGSADAESSSPVSPVE